MNEASRDGTRRMTYMCGCWRAAVRESRSLRKSDNRVAEVGGWGVSRMRMLVDVVLKEEGEVDGMSAAKRVCCRCPSHSHDIHRMMIEFQM